MNNNSAQLTLKQIVNALLSHKLKSLLAFLLVMITVVALYVIWPRQYESEGKIYVQRGGNNTGISPIASNSGVTVQDSQETEIRSVVEIVKSRGVVEKVVDEVGVELILESPWDKFIPEISLPSFLSSGKSKSIDGMSSEEYERLKRRDVAIKALYSDLSIYSEKKTSVVSLYIKANSPQLAQRIIQSLIDNSQRIYNSTHTSKGSTAFFSKQVELAEHRYQKALKSQEKFRNENGFLSIKEARTTVEQIVSDLEKNIITAEIDLASSTKRVKQLKSTFSSTKKQIPQDTSGVERKSFEDAQSDLFRAEDELAQLILQLSNSHPLVQQSKKRLEVMRARARDLQTDRVESIMQNNPVHESLNIQLAGAIAEQAAASARLSALQDQYVIQNERKCEMNALEVSAMQLQDQIGTAHKEWQLFNDKSIEAMAKQEIDNSKLSSIVMIQDPSLVVKHVSPKGSMFLPLGAMMGVMAGLAIALFFERNHLSATLNEGEVEQILEMPVLVTLPRVYSSRNMVN